MVFERLVKNIIVSKENIYRITLYESGIWYEKTFIPIPASYQCFSLAKNYTATAIGIAQDKGLLNIDNFILEYFKDNLPEDYDEKLERVKIQHLLTHTTGNEFGYLFGDDRYAYKNKSYLNVILSKHLEYEPGEKFTYSNSNYYLLSLIIHLVSGLTLEEFLKRNLFSYIDIFEYAFQNSPEGETLGATGMFMSTRDLTKLGILYLNNGEYNGNQVLSRYWTEEATKNQVRLDGAPEYGFGFWIEKDGYCGKGNFGQTVVVLPEQKIVVAANGYGDFDIYFLLNINEFL